MTEPLGDKALPRDKYQAECEDIGEMLKGWRAAMGISQVAMAKRLGCGVNTVARVERGHLDPQIRLLLRWIDFAGMEVRIRRAR